jgi:hypothetical protein
MPLLSELDVNGQWRIPAIHRYRGTFVSFPCAEEPRKKGFACSEVRSRSTSLHTENLCVATGTLL